MRPIYWIVAVVLGAGLGAWQLLPGDGAPAPPVARAAGTPPSQPSISPVAVKSATIAAPEASATPADVARWLADVNAADAAKRAAAITSLSHAPRTQALPALRRVLLNGEPTVDRPLALNSLRELALDQGDADGGIRQAIREVIYHGDDEALAAGAQDALDVVEESELK